MRLQEEEFVDLVEELSYRIEAYSWRQFQRIAKKNPDMSTIDMFGLMLTSHVVFLAQIFKKLEITDAESFSVLLKDTFMSYYTTEELNQKKDREK